MPYCSVSDVQRNCGLSATDLSTADATEFILDAEAEIDRITNTTFWKLEQSGTATAGGAATITNSSAHFGTSSELVGDYVWIYGGTGINQLQKIQSHTDTAITVDTNWTVQPAAGSTYRIIHTGQDPRISEYRIGDGTRVLFTYRFPIVYLSAVTVDSNSVTLSNIYQDLQSGRLEISTSAPQSYWSAKNVQANLLTYWFGVYEVPRIVSKATALFAAMSALTKLMGANYDSIGSINMPEGSLTIGQSYQNILNTLNQVKMQYDQIVPTLPKYAFFI